MNTKTKVFMLILIIYAIASVTLTTINFISINSDSYNFVDVTRNWQTGAIMQIAVSASCPPGYEEAFNYTWPGVSTSCWCGNVSAYILNSYNINYNSISGNCYLNQLLAGCTTVTSTPAVVMDVWAQNENGNMKVCVQRSQETWLQVAQQSGTNCSNGTLKCGFSTENTFCTSEAICPINNVMITNLTLPDQDDTLLNCTAQNNCTVLSQSPTAAKILQYQRGDTFDALPTAQMRLNEYSMCLDSTDNDITPGRVDPGYLSSTRTTCYSEGASLWNWTDSMTESELFALNGLTNTINTLEAFDYYAPGMDGSDYEYSVFTRSYVPWSIDCRGDMNVLVDNDSTIQALRILQLILLIITGIASICLGLVMPLILYQIRYDDNPRLKTFARRFNHIVKLPQLGLQIAVLVISANTKGYFQNIVNKNCSTPLIMQTFDSLASDLQNTFLLNVINISMLLLVIIVGFIYFFEGSLEKQNNSSSYYEPPRQYEQNPNQEIYPPANQGFYPSEIQQPRQPPEYLQYTETVDFRASN